MKTVTESYPEFSGIEINTGHLCRSSNYTQMSARDVSYIVMHYTGNDADTALANAMYFENSKVEASAHYFVDEGNYYQSVGLKDKAWAVGGTSVYKHASCRNANSISIEMCTSGGGIVSEITIENAAKLCAALCKYLNIGANEVDTYVLRHYDVWDKACPAQWAQSNSTGFTAFKTRVKALLNGTSNGYDTYLNKLTAKGYIANADLWQDYTAPIKKCNALALIDKCTGGTWASEEANEAAHWAQKHVYSLCGKGLISNKEQWLTNPDASISQAQTLALAAKIVNNGTTELRPYETTANDHWGRNYLNYLCDKAVITTPEAWTNFEGEVSTGNFMALICKAFGY